LPNIRDVAHAGPVGLVRHPAHCVDLSVFYLLLSL
jgi:hypothetical protein